MRAYDKRGECTMEKVKKTPASLKALVKEFQLEILVKGDNFDTEQVTVYDVNRPALQLVGFFDFFDVKRLQIMGLTEIKYLERMDPDQRKAALDQLMSYPFPALIISRNMEAFPEMLESARRNGRTILRTEMDTVDATSRIIDYLNRMLAPQITRHGVLMNIYGQGVLIFGDSGIGKSETAIELLKRGHRLVADDAVDIKRVSETLHGSAPELIRHYMEIRGVGIIDVQQLFGMGAVQFDTEIDLVIQLEKWEDGKFYDRLGLGDETIDILGVRLPIFTIPVSAGRNLAGIVELATMKNRQLSYGGNSSDDFVTQFDKKIDQLMEEGAKK